MKNNKGFTLVEVVIVLTVMALLAVAALPRVISIITQAKKGSADNIVAAVREGIFLQKISSISEANPLGSYPAVLDSAATADCASGNACFTNVLEAGQDITDSRWNKASATTYTVDNLTRTYTYTNTNGTFLCSGADC